MAVVCWALFVLFVAYGLWLERRGRR
jgi:hypothetical protein